MPKIGYGSNKETRHMLPNGLYNAVINNAKELEMYIMQASPPQAPGRPPGRPQWASRWGGLRGRGEAAGRPRLLKSATRACRTASTA